MSRPGRARIFPKFHLEKSLIDLYTWSTPNGRKVSIMLEELGLPYKVHAIDIGKGDQFAAGFRRDQPQQQDSRDRRQRQARTANPYALFESGAILLYLADKSGRFLPAKKAERFEVIQWLMFQMGGVGPMFGQTHHFLRAAPEPVPYAIERYSKETRRLYGVLDKHLAGREWLGCGILRCRHCHLSLGCPP